MNKKLSKLIRICNEVNASILKYDVCGSVKEEYSSHAIVEDHTGRVVLVRYNDKKGEWE